MVSNDTAMGLDATNLRINRWQQRNNKCTFTQAHRINRALNKKLNTRTRHNFSPNRTILKCKSADQERVGSM